MIFKDRSPLPESMWCTNEVAVAGPADVYADHGSYL